jgi:hypothetical protein
MKFDDGKVVRGSANEIADSMQVGRPIIESGSHSLLVYNDLDGLRQIFASYAKTFLPENEVILFGTQYDNVRGIEYFLQDSGMDVSRHLSDGTLVIVDAQERYQGADPHDAVRFAMNVLARAKKEERRGLTFLGDVGSFFSFDRICDLVDFELFYPARFEENMMKSVCCYHWEDFRNLDEKQQNTLINHHFKTIFVE